MGLWDKIKDGFFDDANASPEQLANRRAALNAPQDLKKAIDDAVDPLNKAAARVIRQRSEAEQARAEDAVNAIEEQRRLFYVAITRATRTLVLSSAASAPYGDAMQMGLTVARRLRGSAILHASPFMSELGASAPAALSGNQWRSQLGF